MARSLFEEGVSDHRATFLSEVPELRRLRDQTHPRSPAATVEECAVGLEFTQREAPIAIGINRMEEIQRESGVLEASAWP